MVISSQQRVRVLGCVRVLGFGLELGFGCGFGFGFEGLRVLGF